MCLLYTSNVGNYEIFDDANIQNNDILDNADER